MFHTGDSKSDPLYVTVIVDDKPIKMEVDTGAGVSIISEKTYKNTWKESQAPPIKPAKIRLRTYTGEEVVAVGRLHVKVKYGQEQKNLSLVVTQGKGPSLLGRDWLTCMRLNWRSLFKVQKRNSLKEILERHKTVFQNELGTIQGTTAKIHVDLNVCPKFCKA